MKMKVPDQEPRIVFFSNAVWDFYQRATPLCEALIELGAEVVFVEPLVYADAKSPHLRPRTRVPVPDGLKVIRRHAPIRRGVWVFIWENLSNVRHFLYLKPSAVVMYSVTSCFLLQGLRSFLPGSRFVLDYIDDWPEWSQVPREKVLLKKFFVPFSVRHSNIVTVTATLLKEDLHRHGKHIVYIPNGAPKEPGAFKEGHIGERPSVVYVGDLSERINLELICEVAKRIPDADFNIIGDGSCLGLMEAAAENVSNLHVHGPKPHDEAMMQIERAALGLIPYHINRLTDRCFPIKLAEYWGKARTAVVVPTQEMKRVARGAVLFAANAREMEIKIRSLIDDENLRNGLAKEGWQRVNDVYNYSKLARNFMEVCTGRL
jgi:glycosyltransferase involved in cell wall biosynthesis